MIAVNLYGKRTGFHQVNVNRMVYLTVFEELLVEVIYE